VSDFGHREGRDCELCRRVTAAVLVDAALALTGLAVLFAAMGLFA
jgi:hypothetical protein